MGDMAGTLRVCTSGFQYDHWRDVFYPRDLRKRDWLKHYAAHFDTVEINNTFYGLPPESTFHRWREQAGSGFCYALKFSRYGTHRKRLIDPADTIGVFLERARHLEGHLGPILVQLPPRWRARPERLDAFLEAAPQDVRWAVELRDPSWLRDDVFAVLRARGAALCIHDLLPEHPLEVTADWLYLRYHGPFRCAGSYAPQALAAEGRWLREHLAAGRDVYAFFNNDAEGNAVRNALQLRECVLAGQDDPASGRHDRKRRGSR
jgi:uncharacterized protein YecE (DUF72 family)